MKKKSDCPGCNENLSPSEWWHDLSLRLKKAVYCLSGEEGAAFRGHFAEAADAAKDISEQLAKLPRDKARRGIQKSDNDPGEEPGRTFSWYDRYVHRRLLRALGK